MAVLDWVIERTDKMENHTNLGVILTPLTDKLDNYQWIISDFELNHLQGTRLSYDKEFFVLSANDIRQIAASDVQIIWGVITAVPKGIEINLTSETHPYADGNSEVFSEGGLQYPGAEIEIVCFDSSYTIVKFSRQDLSDKFKTYFDESIALKNFNNKYS